MGFATSATPPQQPLTGPGGREYAYTEMRQATYGAGGTQYWIFEPAISAPASDGAAAHPLPVIVFLHGWSAMEPGGYGAWIAHLVKRGNIVIYPRYQESLTTPMAEFTPNTVAAVKSALNELATGNHARPDLTRVAVAGHSMGAAISPCLAAIAAQNGLPHFSAIMPVEPGKGMIGAPKYRLEMADLSQISSDTLLLVVVGEDDKIARDETAKEIFANATKIAPANKNYVTMMSDNHGTPALVADHFAPAAPGGGVSAEPSRAEGNPLRERLAERFHKGAEEVGSRMVNALDYYGTWKLLDALTDAAFYKKNREFALGDTPQQRFMGTWSDGVPVKELRVDLVER